MADEIGRMFQRFVVDGATLDLQQEGGLFRRGSKPQTGHVLCLSQGGVQALCSDQVDLKDGDRWGMTVHLRNRRNWLKISGEVRWCRKVPKRPFKRAGFGFVDADADQLRLLRELEHDLLPVQESEAKGQTGRLAETYKLGSGESSRDMDPLIEAERKRFGGEKEQVHRPVALLELITELEKFEVSNALIMAVLESVEQGTSVEDLFGIETQEAIIPKRRNVTEVKPQEDVRPMPVYRLDGKNPLHFNDQGKPITPPVDHLYFSQITDEVCFACELQDDRMAQDSGPSFKSGDVVVFSKTPKVENGDFVFAKTRSDGDEFAQVFFARDDQVRLRPLNGNYPERAMRRGDIRVLYRVIARLDRVR